VVSAIPLDLGQILGECIDLHLYILGEVSGVNLRTRQQCFWPQRWRKGLLKGVWPPKTERAKSPQCPTPAV